MPGLWLPSVIEKYPSDRIKKWEIYTLGENYPVSHFVSVRPESLACSASFANTLCWEFSSPFEWLLAHLLNLCWKIVLGSVSGFLIANTDLVQNTITNKESIVPLLSFVKILLCILEIVVLHINCKCSMSSNRLIISHIFYNP